MNYNEFIKLYPWVDLGLELFKGVMPTIVALLAIYIAGKKEKRANIREEEKSKKQYERDEKRLKNSFQVEKERLEQTCKREEERYRNSLKVSSLIALQNNVIELNNMVFDSGKDFLEYICYINDNEKQKICLEEYRKKIYSMLVYSRKIMSLSQMEAIKIEDETIISIKVFNKVKHYNENLLELNTKCNNMVISGTTYKNVIDYADDEMRRISGDLENEIMDYIIELSEKIKEIISK